MFSLYDDYYRSVGWTIDYHAYGRFIPKRSTVVKNKRRRKRR